MIFFMIQSSKLWKSVWFLAGESNIVLHKLKINLSSIPDYSLALIAIVLVSITITISTSA